MLDGNGDGQLTMDEVAPGFQPRRRRWRPEAEVSPAGITMKPFRLASVTLLLAVGGLVAAARVGDQIDTFHYAFFVP